MGAHSFLYSYYENYLAIIRHSHKSDPYHITAIPGLAVLAEEVSTYKERLAYEQWHRIAW